MSGIGRGGGGIGGKRGRGAGIEGAGYGVGSLESLGREIDFYRKFRENGR